MLNQNIPTPLYEQLKNVIKEEILQRVYLPGERMPSEQELEKKYKVSRITVRRAVKELCEEGILVRKQGKGTFVLNNKTCERLDGPSRGFHDCIEKEGKRASVEILDKNIIHVNTSYAKDLQIDVNDEVIYLRRLMYADDVPAMIDTSYIPLKRFPELYEKLNGNVALFRIMEQDYGVYLENYYKVLKVQKATKEMSRLLNCHYGDPMFNLLKISYNRDNEPQLISVSILRGEDTCYVISNNKRDEINYGGIIWSI